MNKFHHGEAFIAADEEGKLVGRVEGEVIDGTAMDMGECLKVDEAVGVKEGEEAIGVGREEVAGEGEGGREGGAQK